MKTNQLMQVTIGSYSQSIEHKTMMGHLNALWDHGNGLRAIKGLAPLQMKDWLMSNQTRELVDALNKKYLFPNSGNSTITKVDSRGRSSLVDLTSNTPFIKTKRGTGGGTWVHLYLMLDAAAWLDADFKLQLYDTFINNKILQWREDSGDEFINLNIAIDAYLPEREGKENTGIFIQVAKQLKEKILNEGAVWNTANFNQLEKRAKIEKDLCGFLKLGMIRNYEHLKEVIARL